MMRKKEDKEKIAVTEDVSDIERKLSDGVDPYLIMIGEFRSTGPLERLVGNRHGNMSIRVTSLCGITFLTRVNLQKTNLGKLQGKV
jgi:hypothetical protein